MLKKMKTLVFCISNMFDKMFIHYKQLPTKHMKTTRRDFLKKVSIGSAGVLLGSSLLGCAEKKPAETPKPKKGEVPSEPLKLGVLAYLSGVAAVPGKAAWNTTQMWVEKVNASGGILGRKIELVMEEEGKSSETVDKFRKLTVEKKVEAIFGLLSTGNGQAVGPVAEELHQLWLSWDATTQSGLEETLPNAFYSFRSVYNEAEAIAGALATVRLFPDIKTVGAINNDYSYGRNGLKAFMTVVNHFLPDVELVIDLWPKLGETDFSSHVAALKQADPDLIMTSFWSGDVPILMKQGYAAGLWEGRKACFTTGGGVHTTLKKSFTPEGIILGYNSYYPFWSSSWKLSLDFNREYYQRFGDYPVYECDHAYFVLEAYKTAVERAYDVLGKWPEKEDIVEELRGIVVPTPSGYRGYREDNYMIANYFQGITAYDPNYDFVVCKDVEILTPAETMHPPGMSFDDWVKSWK